MTRTREQRRKFRPKFWRKKWRSLYIWHRYLGLSAAFLVVILSVTGVMLNHTERLNLSGKYVTSNWLLDWYGIAAKTPMVSFPLAQGEWLSALDGHLFSENTALGEITGPVVGAAQTKTILAVATPSSLLLYTHDRELIETLNDAALPGRIEAIGLGKNDNLTLETDAGVFVANAQVTTWTPAAPSNVTWARAMRPPERVNNGVMGAYRGAGLEWERVLLDLHSGRIVGDWGLYIMDGAAVLLLILSGSGIYIWMKSKRRQKQ